MLVCVYHCVCAHVYVNGVSVRAWILKCVFIYNTYTTLVSICLQVCVCISVYTWALFKLKVFNSSVCGCVFIQTDAVWWSECQHCSRLPITVCYLRCLLCFCLFVPDCWVTDSFIHLSVSVFLCRLFDRSTRLTFLWTLNTNSLTKLFLIKYVSLTFILRSFGNMFHSQKFTVQWVFL